MNRRITDLIHKALTAAFVLIAALGVVFGAKAAFGKTLTLSKETTHTLKGYIGPETLLFATELTLSVLHNTEVNILIDSPGGLVGTAKSIMETIQQAQKAGVKVVCVVVNEAYSMAFYIFSTCHNRYAIKGSVLLWHYPYTVINTGGKAQAETLINKGNELLRYRRYLDSIALPTLDIPYKVYDMHARNNTFFTVEALNKLAPSFLTPIDNVEVK